jgi:hypothetical protein
MTRPRPKSKRIETMAKKKNPKIEDNFVMYDVIYEDGSKSSRRKVNAAGLMRDEIEAFALTEIMNQDRKIAEMSGKSRGQVKSITKSAA